MRLCFKSGGGRRRPWASGCHPSRGGKGELGTSVTSSTASGGLGGSPGEHAQQAQSRREGELLRHLLVASLPAAWREVPRAPGCDSCLPGPERRF